MKRAAGLMVGLSLGSSVVQAAPLSPQDFAFGLPVITNQEAAAYRFSLPLVGSRRVLGGSTRLVGKPAAFPWMRAVLWSVLLLAVVLLAWMAYRLANEPGR
jgi:hypothetical protein